MNTTLEEKIEVKVLPLFAQYLSDEDTEEELGDLDDEDLDEDEDEDDADDDVVVGDDKTEE